tara:strand:+ start:667 stop:1935 length:1269 start_codon:yes stop_codon:yes gene_type:complete
LEEVQKLFYLLFFTHALFGNCLLYGADVVFPHFKEPPHEYQKRIPTDRFSKLKVDIETGKVHLDQTDPKAYLLSLLRTLGISPFTQTLVFSTTSLQLSRISPENPRAIYFNEDIYVGWVPGGKIEVIGMDPQWGAITYMFEIPRPKSPPSLIQRSTRCMNCHASSDIGGAPGLLISSVVPGPGGGSLDAFRQENSGHEVPFSERFGGWHVTGKHGITKHWGNITGTLSPAGLKTIPNKPGQRFQLARYPVRTSDILAHLLFEHQVGFVNRVVSAAYRARAVLAGAVPSIGDSDAHTFLDEEANSLVRYLLFADEAKFPAAGVEGYPLLLKDFSKNNRQNKMGFSLKDLDLSTRLFRFRCSYMIYSDSFAGLPQELKMRVFHQLDQALSIETASPHFAYLPLAEKRTIRSILRETLSGLPKDW